MIWFLKQMLREIDALGEELGLYEEIDPLSVGSDQ